MRVSLHRLGILREARQSTLEEMIENELNEQNMSEEVNLPTQAGPDLTTSTTTTHTTTMSRNELERLHRIPAQQEIRRPGIIDINLNDVHEKVKLGYSRLAKDDVGFGSIQAEYGLTFSEVKELFNKPVLKGIRRGRSRVRIADGGSSSLSPVERAYYGGRDVNTGIGGAAEYSRSPEVLNDTPEFARFIEESTARPATIVTPSPPVGAQTDTGIRWMSLDEYRAQEEFYDTALRNLRMPDVSVDRANEAIEEIERLQREQRSRTNEGIQREYSPTEPETTWDPHDEGPEIPEVDNAAREDLREAEESLRQARQRALRDSSFRTLETRIPAPEQPTVAPLDPEIARLDEMARRLMGNIQGSPVNREPIVEEIPRGVDPDNGDFREDDDYDEDYDDDDLPADPIPERDPVLQAAIDNYNERRRVGETLTQRLLDIGHLGVPNDPAEAYRAGRAYGQSILDDLAEAKRIIDQQETERAQKAEIERLKEESKKNPSLIQVIQGVAAGAAERELKRNKKEILKSIFS